MKKIKLDARKLQLKKEKIASLTNEQMGQVFGGQEITTATFQTCCVLTKGPTNQLCIATNTCKGGGTDACAQSTQCNTGAGNCNTGYDPTDCSSDSLMGC